MCLFRHRPPINNGFHDWRGDGASARCNLPRAPVSFLLTTIESNVAPTPPFMIHRPFILSATLDERDVESFARARDVK